MLLQAPGIGKKRLEIAIIDLIIVEMKCPQKVRDYLGAFLCIEKSNKIMNLNI